MLISGVNIFRLGNSFKIKNGITIYIDPYAVYDQEKADLILISHDHVDSCSREDIEKLLKDDTIIVGTSSVADKLQKKINIVKPGDELEFFDVMVKIVHAYNSDVTKRYHIKGNGVGFKLMLGNTIVYYSGHTDFIPEMRELGNIDIALISVGHLEVMNVDDAVDACNVIKAPYVVPFYYTSDEGDLLGQHTANSKVVLL